jgi:hypothetical protein
MSSTLLLPHAHSFVKGPAVINTHTAPTFPVDENILGFDVTVDNSIIVQVRQPEQRIQEHAPHFWPFGPLIAVNPLVE